MITVGLLGMALVAAGQGQAAPAAGVTHERHIEVQGKHRSYSFHLPKGHQPYALPPLVVGFHGFNTNGSVMESVNLLSATGDQYGFIVAYPNAAGAGGVLRRWNMQGDPNRPDDVAFVAAMLDDLARTVPYDARRVYLVGKSSGGSMAYRVASALPERIAAVASISGPLAADSTFHAGPAVSVLHFHGTNDRLVPIDGNWPGTPRALQTMTADETIGTWVALNNCPGAPAVGKIDADEHDRTSVEFRTYGPGRDGSEVIFCRIEGGGHTWPGGNPPPLLFGRVTREIWANDVIWQFFSRHSR